MTIPRAVDEWGNAIVPGHTQVQVGVPGNSCRGSPVPHKRTVARDCACTQKPDLKACAP